jgi:hypothetical protein
MKIKKTFVSFWKTFFHVQVIGFMLIGAGVIFLTFFTNNNALEIAISAVASVFIGIGVNNFSTFETKEQDKRKLEARRLHANQTLEFVRSRISKLHRINGERLTEELKRSLEELEEFLDFAAHLKDEDDFIN